MNIPLVNQQPQRNMDITLLRIQLASQVMIKMMEIYPSRSATMHAEKSVEQTDCLLAALMRTPTENTTPFKS